MARSRKKTEIQTEAPVDEAAIANDSSDVFGEVIANAQALAEQNATALADHPPAPVVDAPSLNGNGQAHEGNGHAPEQAAGQSQQQETSRPRSVITQVIDGKTVHLIDEGNRGGVGIKFDGLAEDEIPSAEVRDILKDGDLRDRTTARMGWQEGQWRTRVDYHDPAATRDTAQRKFNAITEIIEEGRGFEKRQPKQEGQSR